MNDVPDMAAGARPRRFGDHLTGACRYAALYTGLLAIPFGFTALFTIAMTDGQAPGLVSLLLVDLVVLALSGLIAWPLLAAARACMTAWSVGKGRTGGLVLIVILLVWITTLPAIGVAARLARTIHFRP